MALEGSPGLLRIASTGAIRAIGDLTQADDVASAGDLLYVTLIDAGQVVAVDPASGAHRVLVNGIGRAAAQGLAVLPDGRLALSDSATGLVATFSACA